MPRKTVLVVGAGASNEAGMPTGHTLKGRISQLLNIRFDSGGFRRISGDEHIYEAIRLHVQQVGLPPQEINSHLYACWHIIDAMPQAISIDNFIHSQEGDARIVLCGKLAIVRAILEAEKGSLLKIRDGGAREQPDLKAVENTWFVKFVQLLTKDCTRQALRERLSQITFIVFNYDRCIEHFLFNALRSTYNLQDKEAAELLSHIEIFHPYGSVGPLPWQQPRDAVQFGAGVHAQSLLALSKDINTFAEGTNSDDSEIEAIHQRIAEAETFVYLGFAYHDQNIKLLTPGRPLPEVIVPADYFGTAMGISDHDRKIICDDLIGMLAVGSKSMQIDLDTSCAALFDRYNRGFSRSFWTRS